MPARPNVAAAADRRLRQFENPEVLGASRQLAIAADVLVAAAREYEGTSAGLARMLSETVAYLVALRGEASQAVPNALRLMLDGLNDARGLDVDALREWVVRRVRDYDADARRRFGRVVEFGAALVFDSDRLLAYDYSSSVAAILKELVRREQRPTVVIPEARTLDGGRRYVEDLVATGLPLELVPDAAIGGKMRGCDAALIGAETISADGGCYNTTGSLLVALACQRWGVPLYVPSTLIKIDARTLHGYRRPIPDLGPARLARLTDGWSFPGLSQVAVSCPDLDYVPPDVIAGFVTEAGVLPPAAIAGHAARLLGEGGGDRDGG